MRRRWNLATAGTVAAVVATTSAASAAWTDTATLDTASIGAHQVVAQAQPACETYGGILGLLTGARMTWSHVDPRYEYFWVARRADNSTVVASGVVTPTGPAGSTVTLEMTTNLLDLGLGSRRLNIAVTARLRGSASWVAETSTSTPVTTSAVLVGLNVRCG
ncbi:hypothetical protein JL108_10530 [Aeromicrobium sp. YIM 150415]|uniref:hypothetical protein n=1 Tax=Aeromicrobium sp. YIM 150415 TaxID=2803912 RepID=UPI0019654192|nr:hypothetical protein [Aeromicrobium sp. YIM 150415]MBM9463881.1 hypothetical protein [Aeromicrobium sp. YIM 150415]